VPTVNDAGIEFDKQEQLERIQSDLIPGERLFFVFDCKGAGTGYVGVTDRRLVFQDKTFMHKHSSIVTVPFSKITAVAAEDSGHVFKTSKLAIVAGAQTYEFEFRSDEKAHKAYRLILEQTLQGELAG
jgi:hypothetical protein